MQIHKLYSIHTIYIYIYTHDIRMISVPETFAPVSPKVDDLDQGCLGLGWTGSSGSNGPQIGWTTNPMMAVCNTMKGWGTPNFSDHFFHGFFSQNESCGCLKWE